MEFYFISGKRVINEFDEIDSATCTVDWYKFPKKCLPILPIILMSTQKAEHINCFGEGIVCTRELFQKVNSTQVQTNDVVSLC